ncbi:streptophobe family protein [Streptomyces monticola]|uniref:Streptophobe family protein n=1 Tax=Streptomyces monticola TaxID=2666263 RepID=A0ABW2JLG0_9ACTN
MEAGATGGARPAAPLATAAPGVRWGEVLLAAVASVSWAMIGMAGVAALGLHLLDADSAGSLGPMTAAVVVLGAGGSVTPSGDVSAFGLDGAEATTAIEVTPLGVGLTGALLLAFFFLRSLRAAGVVITPAELAARVGSVATLFLAMLAGLAWAGHDTITIDGGSLGLDEGPGGGLTDDIKDKLPDGLGDIGGLLPDRIGDLVDAEASVGFTVDTGASLLGGALWVGGVLLIALLASRRTPLPARLEAVHRVVRPAASALVAVLLVAVLAGLAAAAYAMAGDDHPRRIAGAALLGAPNGVWLGVPVGLLVPWNGKATGELAQVLPDPVDELLRLSAAEPVTLPRLAELDSRVWLLLLAAAVTMLYAGVLTAVRTPLGGQRAPAFAARCAVRLGAVTALALPLLVWLTAVSADASLSVLGIDAFGAGIELRGQAGTALLLGAAWGAGAGALGALLAYVSGAAGSGVAPLAGGTPRAGRAEPFPAPPSYLPEGAGTATSQGPGRAGPQKAGGSRGEAAGPYGPGPAHHSAPTEANPYLRPPGGGNDVYSAETVAGPLTPPPPVPRRRPPEREREREGQEGAGRERERGRDGEQRGWPVPPPPPPPPRNPPPRTPPPRRPGPPPPDRPPRGQG